MPYYEVANLVTVTETNMIDEMPCAYGTLRVASRPIYSLLMCPMNPFQSIASAKNISIWAEWLRQSGRAQSERSEPRWWQTTPRPGPKRRVALHIALQSQFRHFHRLCRYLIVNENCGVVAHCDHMSEWVHWHQQKIFPSGRNGSVRADALRQSRQRHPGGGLLRAHPQYHTSGCISPSDRCFTVSSCSVSLLF